LPIDLRQYAQLIAKAAGFEGNYGLLTKSPSLCSKFLKLSYRLHETQGTFDLKDPNMDGVLDIYDLGVAITHLITRISGGAQKKPMAETPQVRPAG